MPRALRERLDQHLLFSAFRASAVSEGNAVPFAALKGDRADRRLAAIELLDNVLPSIEIAILPILESSDKVVGRGKFEVKRLLERKLSPAAVRSGHWLRVLTLHEIGSLKIHALAEDCRPFATDGDPWTREAAAWALSRW